jgi:hypothetical protein
VGRKGRRLSRRLAGQERLPAELAGAAKNSTARVAFMIFAWLLLCLPLWQLLMLPRI